MTPLEAIRAKCLDCVYDAGEVKLCTVVKCPLHAFRFGKNPYVKRQMTEEQRKAALERLKLAREKKKEGK
jgi:rhamnogalacturonyl hydrolase YesR